MLLSTAVVTLGCFELLGAYHVGIEVYVRTGAQELSYRSAAMESELLH